MPVLKEDTLLAMQKAARERYRMKLQSVSFFESKGKHPESKATTVKLMREITVPSLVKTTVKVVDIIVLPEPVKEDSSPAPVIDFTKLTRFQKEPKPEKKIIRYFKEPPVEPDERKPIVRPPAKYSNTSPYGIASELLLEK